ncbi:MAG: DNA gyrase subunit A [Candidatus Woesearchaeota archaeon]
MEGNIVKKIIEKEMKQSYLDYAMSVIVGRALPDVRDGLKPVHRRVLFAMQQMGMFHNKPSKKSARIVGEVLGKYHPHGDTAVYDTLVRMAQPFSLRYPLVQGQGNFGSVDGDNAAAMRYTEARLAKIADELLQDLDKNTVEFVPNFDTSLEEPSVLPSKLPNLIINGSSGIAVGMATNIPPHNIMEVADAIIAQINNPEITVDELMSHIKGPDFPTAATIIGSAGIRQAYKTGRGQITVRAKVEVEEAKEKRAIIVQEIPYMVNKAQLVEKIANCIKAGNIKGIADLRDESDRDGMRIVIDLKKEANQEVVLNQLYKHTRMQTTFGINILALVGNQPKTLSLKQLVQHFIEHRQLVIKRRTQFDLEKAEQRTHILEGLLIALNSIDEIISLIKKSDSADNAKQALMRNYALSETQAKAILDMRLQRLTALEQEKVREEHKVLLNTIKALKAILASGQRILEIIIDEMQHLKADFGDQRKTAIIEGMSTDFVAEDLIRDESMVITITKQGYIKRTKPELYKQQHRGGKGVIAATTKEEDFITDVFVANTHSYLLFFTNKGRVYWLKVHEVPEASRVAKGKPIVNLLQLSPDEQITAAIPVSEFTSNHYLIMATKQGVVNKTTLIQYSNPRKGGITAINLDQHDTLVDVVMTDGNSTLMLATKCGRAVRFRERDVRTTGRSTRGVRGILLRKEDTVIGMVVAYPDKTLLTLTQNGYGKRTNIEEYRLIKRGGRGVININCSPRNGGVVAVLIVDDSDEIICVSKEGILIRVPAKDISVIGRNTQGVRLMRLNPGDQLTGTAKVVD